MDLDQLHRQLAIAATRAGLAHPEPGTARLQAAPFPRWSDRIAAV